MFKSLFRREQTPDDPFVGQVLRECAFDDHTDERFVADTLRKVRLDAKSRTIRYWSPMILSAAVGGLAVLALLQILLSAPTIQPTQLRGEEARLDIPVIRDFTDSSIPTDR